MEIPCEPPSCTDPTLPLARLLLDSSAVKSHFWRETPAWSNFSHQAQEQLSERKVPLWPDAANITGARIVCWGVPLGRKTTLFPPILTTYIQNTHNFLWSLRNESWKSHPLFMS